MRSLVVPRGLKIKGNVSTLKATTKILNKSVGFSFMKNSTIKNVKFNGV